MKKKSKIYVPGHNGMVGSAIWRGLKSKGFKNLIGLSSAKLDLTNQNQVNKFFDKEKPEYVFLAAAKVGGILANNTYRADFIYENLQIQNNVIHKSYLSGVKKLLFLGSSCIYPANCPQPIKEDYLLTGELESTNEPYAIAKIAGIKMCESYNRQYGTKFISVMPTNLYGPGDNYDLKTSHVLPAIIRKLHLGKCLEQKNWDSIRSDLNKRPINGIDGSYPKNKILDTLVRFGIKIDKYGEGSSRTNLVSISFWGSGNPMREFLYVDDMALACIHLMQEYDKNQFVNIGSGDDISIKDLVRMVKSVLRFEGKIKFDNSMPDGTKKKLLNISLLKKIGWKQKVGLEKGIRLTYSDFNNC